MYFLVRRNRYQCMETHSNSHRVQMCGEEYRGLRSQPVRTVGAKLRSALYTVPRIYNEVIIVGFKQVNDMMAVCWTVDWGNDQEQRSVHQPGNSLRICPSKADRELPLIRRSCNTHACNIKERWKTENVLFF